MRSISDLCRQVHT